MTLFSCLASPTRALFALWALLLCLACIWNAVSAAVKKRFGCAALALALFAPVYFLWQVIFDLSLFGVSKDASAVTSVICDIAWLWWLMAMAVLTLAALMLLKRNLRYDRDHITPGAIKLYLDKVPCGVCCFCKNGRVLFSNVCMNRLCAALTGTPLLNGSQFAAAVGDGIVESEGKVWRFSSREITLDRETLREMIASDITSEYAKTRALEKEKAELSELNAGLREYYASIGEVVRRQEILQAKINIHDEMNRLMLSTAAAKSNDTAELDRIFALWEQNALLLCLQAGEKSGARAAESVEKLAHALKTRVKWQSGVPDELTETQKELFACAAREAVVNAVKHANAKEILISFEKTETRVLCRFENADAGTRGEVRFAGGLANLEKLAEKQGAAVSAENNGNFTLCIDFPVQSKNEGGKPDGV
ncbi:MAG: hypothetical protein J5760_02545 [Clostridia bacterium]|nr:hypothetical protein [Clostridia bacterium]